MVRLPSRFADEKQDMWEESRSTSMRAFSNSGIAAILTRKSSHDGHQPICSVMNCCMAMEPWQVCSVLHEMAQHILVGNTEEAGTTT